MAMISDFNSDQELNPNAGTIGNDGFSFTTPALSLIQTAPERCTGTYCMCMDSGKAPPVVRLGERPASGGLTLRQMVSGGRRKASSLFPS